MNLKYFMLIVGLALIISLIEPISVSAAPVEYVGSGGGCPGSAYPTLQMALANVNNGGTIIFCSNVVEEVDNIVFNKDVVVDGAGFNWTVNDTTPSSPSLTIDIGKNVVFKDINIQFQKDFGALGIYWRSIEAWMLSNFTLINSQLRSIMEGFSPRQIRAFSDSAINIYSSELYIEGGTYTYNLEVFAAPTRIYNSYLEAQPFGTNIISRSYYGTQTNIAINNSILNASLENLNLGAFGSNAIVLINDSTFFAGDRSITLVSYSSNFIISIDPSTLSSDYTTVYVNVVNNSNISLLFFNTVLNSTNRDVIYFRYVNYSSVYLLLDDVNLTAYRYGLWLDRVQNYSDFDMELYNTMVYSLVKTFNIDTVSDWSNLTILIIKSNISSASEAFEIDSVLYNSSLNYTVINSFISSNNEEVLVLRDVLGDSNASVKIVNSTLISNLPGMFISRIWNNSTLEYMLINSNLTSDSTGLSIFSVSDGSLALIEINSSIVDADGDGLRISRVLMGSRVDLDIDNSTLVSDDEEAVYLFRINNSVVDIYVSSSSLTSDEEGIQLVDTLWWSNVTLNIMSSNISVPDDQGIYFNVVSRFSRVDMEIRSSNITSEDEVVRVGYVNRFSNVTIRVNPTYMRSIHQEAFYINRINDNSIVNMTILDSILKAPGEQTIEFENATDNSNIYLTIINSVLRSHWNTYGLEIDLDPTSDAEVYINRSVVGGIAVFGGDSPVLFVFESVVNESVSQVSPQTSMYVEWTVGIAVYGVFGQPIAGAVVQFFNGSSFLGASMTDGFGVAYFTYSYYFRNGTTFDDLWFRAFYRGSSNTTYYIDYNRSHTLPSWYATLDIRLPLLFSNLPVAGSPGVGSLTLSTSTGKLVLRTPYSQTVKVYMLRYSGMLRAGDFMLVNIEVYIDGVWIDGFIYIDLRSRLVYIKTAGIELYGRLNT